MRVLSVVGARPQFVKLAAVAVSMSEATVEHVIVHTGQHYDDLMSEVFFTDLRIPTPDVHLGVGSGGHGMQTGAMLASLEPILEEHRPDWVLVYGDTNSTLAGAVSAVKLHLPVAHLEAGLRSFNRVMPEEHNRVLTDHAADLCLAPSVTAMANLEREGLAARSVLVGDVMTDILYRVRHASAGSAPARPRGMPAEGGYYVATIHRAENTDDPRRLGLVVAALASLDRPVVLLAHPRLVARAAAAGIELQSGAVHVNPPLPYPALLSLVAGSMGVVTDSGGLQKEAFLLGVPCTTLRAETEWTETVELGWNVLAGGEAALRRLSRVVSRPMPPPPVSSPYGDGHAADRVVELLLSRKP